MQIRAGARNASGTSRHRDPRPSQLLWFVRGVIACLGLSGCQAMVSPTWTIPPGVSTQSVNGYPLAYSARGAGPTIVFVHGILVDYRYWETPLETWTTDFRVIAVSLRHFYPEKWDGKGSDFTIRQHTKDLIAFIESTGGPVYLVGWSYGGRPAFEVARARPDLVKKLVLVEGSVFLLPESDPNAPVRKRAIETAKFFDSGDLEGGAQFAVDSINGPGFWAKLPEPRRQVVRDNAWTVVGYGRDDLGRVTCEEFGSLKMPVLLVMGELTGPRLQQIVAEQSKCLPQATVAKIPKAAHPSPSMNPSAFKEAVVTFLQH